METTPTTPQNPNPSDASTPSGARNTFLTIICILTFVGSGWGVIKAIRSYATADAVAAIAGDVMKNVESQVGQQQNTPGFVKSIMGSVTEGMTPDNIRNMAIFQFISNLLTLFGAIMMWRLKKTGFYLYIAGIVLLVAAPIALFKLVGIFSGAFTGFIGVIFIVMYGVNLKYMTK